jgi:hypothetical protein
MSKIKTCHWFIISLLINLLVINQPDKMMIMKYYQPKLVKVNLIEYVKECYSIFSSRTKEINKKKEQKTEFLVEALSSLKDVNNSKDAVEFESIVNKSENKIHLESLKEMLLDSQLYEFVSIVDNIYMKNCK